MTNANIDRDWDSNYAAGDTPWDSGIPSKELFRVLDEQSIAPCRAIELGCGTGTNAIALAERGFDVTAVDCSSRALESARRKAHDAGASIVWKEADVQRMGFDLQPFDFVFDRGCYHCCRRVDLEGYLQSLTNLTMPGSRVLILAGNANEQTEYGPPRVTEQELRDELGRVMSIEFLREFRFEDSGGVGRPAPNGGVQGPLGWSVLLKRRESGE